MRNGLQVLPDAAAAALYAASAGIVAGALGCLHTGSLAYGARTALAGFLVSAALLAVALWRTHRSHRQAFLDRAYHGQ